QMVQEILRLIAELRPQPPPALAGDVRCHAFKSSRQKECVQMPGKMARWTLDQAFGLPEVLVAVSTSRLSCKRAGKTRTLMLVWDSSGESRYQDVCDGQIFAPTRRGCIRALVMGLERRECLPGGRARPQFPRRANRSGSGHLAHEHCLRFLCDLLPLPDEQQGYLLGIRFPVLSGARRRAVSTVQRSPRSG